MSLQVLVALPRRAAPEVVAAAVDLLAEADRAEAPVDRAPVGAAVERAVPDPAVAAGTAAATGAGTAADVEVRFSSGHGFDAILTHPLIAPPATWFHARLSDPGEAGPPIVSGGQILTSFSYKNCTVSDVIGTAHLRSWQPDPVAIGRNEGCNEHWEGNAYENFSRGEQQ